MICSVSNIRIIITTQHINLTDSILAPPTKANNSQPRSSTRPILRSVPPTSHKIKMFAKTAITLALLAIGAAPSTAAPLTLPFGLSKCHPSHFSIISSLMLT